MHRWIFKTVNKNVYINVSQTIYQYSLKGNKNLFFEIYIEINMYEVFSNLSKINIAILWTMKIKGIYINIMQCYLMFRLVVTRIFTMRAIAMRYYITLQNYFVCGTFESNIVICVALVILLWIFIFVVFNIPGLYIKKDVTKFKEKRFA